MSMLLEEFSNQNGYSVALNTGTILDLSTGKYQLGFDNKWYLNGGMYLTTGIGGRGNTYKSGLAGSFLTRLMTNYKDSEAIVYESEFNIADQSRYNDFLPPEADPINLSRILFINPSQKNLSEWFELAKDFGEKKIARKKEYIVETPFIDPSTMKKARIMIPTIMVIDSFSKATGSAEAERYEDNEVDSSDMNMLYMQDGKLKTLLMRQLPNMATKYGMYFILTAHVKDQSSMASGNSRTPPPKELQFMKQRDKFKGVGTDFEFLTTTLMQNWGAKVMQTTDDKKTCLYPLNSNSPSLEVQEVPNIMLRCKNNASGTNISWIMSQYMGLLNEVTNFHLLKQYKNYGMTAGSKNSFNLMLKPEDRIHRTNIREIMNKSYPLRRAMELTTQLCYIQNNWFLPKLPEIVSIPIETFAEKLTKSTNPTVGDVLNSTGCWTYGKPDRTYMSLFDILKLVQDVK